MADPIIACSLSASHQAERVEAAAGLRHRALVGSAPIPSGLRLRFAAEPGVREELERLIEAESECCPFLRFALEARERELVLEVGGPEEARPVIRRLFGLAGSRP
jgi:hypothetical protein